MSNRGTRWIRIFALPSSVTRLFDLIQDAIDRDAASIIVEYQTSLGYPFDISIDYDAAVADEEVRYETTQITTFQ